jgi:hypothetical protein
MIIREEIFNRVVAQLQRIRTGNTYTMYGMTQHYLTDAGLHVFPWRATTLQPNELPALIVRDLDEPVILANNQSARVTRQLHVQVEAAIADNTPMTILRQIYSDIEAAFGEGRESVWADITIETRPRITRAVVEQESRKIAGGIFEVFIDYPTFAFLSNIPDPE